MKWYQYVIMIVIAVVVVLIMGLWPPDGNDGDNGDPMVNEQSNSAGGYQTWLYIDEINNKPVIRDIDGTRIEDDIVTYNEDKLIFVNRTEDDVSVSFASAAIFGPNNHQVFTIAPFKRVIRTVIGQPGDYAFVLGDGTGPVTPPKVKVGNEP